jgi:hypothetical protein
VLPLTEPPEAVAGLHPDAVLLCGPLEREIAFLRLLLPLLPDALVGAVSPGLASFAGLLNADPEGLLAPVQWHEGLTGRPELGPTSDEVAAAARAAGLAELDYVGAQAYAAALVAERCLEEAPDDPLRAAHGLRTTTFFDGFGLDRDTGLQVGHRLAVVRWERGRRRLLVPAAA